MCFFCCLYTTKHYFCHLHEKRFSNKLPLKFYLGFVVVMIDINHVFTGQSIAEWLKRLPGITTDENAVRLGQMLINNKDVFSTDGSR